MGIFNSKQNPPHSIIFHHVPRFRETQLMEELISDYDRYKRTNNIPIANQLLDILKETIDTIQVANKELEQSNAKGTKEQTETLGSK